MGLVLLVVIFCVTVAFYFLKRHYEYWERKGVPGPKPTLFVGNVGAKQGDVRTEIYNQYQNLPLVGIYEGFNRSILIRDPYLIQEITTTSFKNFHDNTPNVSRKLDPLLGRQPFYLKGNEWEKTRTILEPFMTSEAKMKVVYPSIEDISGQFVSYIESESDHSENGVEAKEVSSKFLLNIAAGCVFGLDGNYFEDANNRIIQNSVRRLSTISVDDKWFMSNKKVPKDLDKQILEQVLENLAQRKERNVIKKDIVYFLDRIKEQTDNFTEIDVAAHTAEFMGHGYETSLQVMSFVLFHLAEHPKVQKTLRQELSKAFEENHESLPYEVLQGLTYLDAVLSESLRMHPPFYSLSKTCTSEYTYTASPGDGLGQPTVTIEKGTNVILPVYGLHNDAKYYKEPYQFRPERFLGENREKLVKNTYLPFGEGPRTCLGQLFGKMQIKAGIAYTLLNFELSVNQKTQTPLKFDPAKAFLVPIGGLWLDFKRIE